MSATIDGWYWYVAGDDELFIDCDRWDRAHRRIARRLAGGMESGALSVNAVYLYPSQTENHVHIIVSLIHRMPPAERFAWEMILGSDVYRGCCNIMRWLFKVGAPDVFITKRMLHREPEGKCDCAGKHGRDVMLTCPIALTLRKDMSGTGYFGRTSRNLKALRAITKGDLKWPTTL